MTTAISRPLIRKPLISPRTVSRKILRQRPAPEKKEEPSLLDSWNHDLVDQAVEWVNEHAASMPERPDIDPQMPNDVTELTSVELGRLHAQFVAVVEWLDVARALADISASNAEAFLEHVKSEVRLQKSGTVQDKTAKTLKDKRVFDAEQKFFMKEARAKILKARVGGMEKCAAALSREMTRRQVIQENEG